MVSTHQARKRKCSVSELSSFWSLTVSALWDFVISISKGWGVIFMLETKSCFRTLELHRAHSLLRCQTNSCYPCLWKSNSWCFLTWCYVYISWSNESVPCWKWSHIKGQYSDTVGLIMESHNLINGKVLWLLSTIIHQIMQSNWNVQWQFYWVQSISL